MSALRVKDIEEYLGPYEILLANRIREKIDMFDEGLTRWFRNPKSRNTLKGRRSYKIVTQALKVAKQDREIFVRTHSTVPTKALAILFQVSPVRISQMKNGRKPYWLKAKENK